MVRPRVSPSVNSTSVKTMKQECAHNYESLMAGKGKHSNADSQAMAPLLHSLKAQGLMKLTARIEPDILILYAVPRSSPGNRLRVPEGYRQGRVPARKMGSKLLLPILGGGD